MTVEETFGWDGTQWVSGLLGPLTDIPDLTAGPHTIDLEIDFATQTYVVIYDTVTYDHSTDFAALALPTDIIVTSVSYGTIGAPTPDGRIRIFYSFASIGTTDFGAEDIVSDDFSSDLLLWDVTGTSGIVPFPTDWPGGGGGGSGPRGPITIRHIFRLDEGSDGLARQFLGRDFEPNTDGLNDYSGYQSGQYTTRVNDAGDFQLLFPNVEASDLQRHLDRFGISRQLTEGEPAYQPGDEWIEIYDDFDLMFIGTPTGYTATRASLTLTGQDPWWLLKKQREFYSGFWHHAPRDIWDHYSQVWRVELAEDFTDNSEYSGSGTTDDGRISFDFASNDLSGQVRIAPGSAHTGGWIRGADGSPSEFTMGLGSDSPYSTWQVKAEFSRPKFGSDGTDDPTGGDNAQARVGLFCVDSSDAETPAASWSPFAGTVTGDHQPFIYVALQERSTYLVGPNDVNTDDTAYHLNAKLNSDAGEFEVIVEGRDRWIYFFVNQVLIGVLPMPFGPYTVVPFAGVMTGDDSSFQYIDVETLLCRRTRPYLMKGGEIRGDYHLPVDPPPGGLWARYYNDQNVKINAGQQSVLGIADSAVNAFYTAGVFNPVDDDNSNYLVLQRLDKKLNFTGTGDGGYITTPDDDGWDGKSTWQPRDASSDGLWWSVRWIGSIHLNLEDHDYTLRTHTFEEGARVWVGKTRMREQIIDNWLVNLGDDQTSDSLRTHIGEDENGDFHNGWYPIVIEFGNRASAGAAFKLSYNVDGGEYNVVPTSMLSPFGIFHDQIRADSFFEAIQTMIDTYGYQGVVEPRALENVAFPGQLVPRRKVGRDSDHIVTSTDLDVQDFQATVDATDTARSVLGDGSGMATDAPGGGLTAEALDYDTAEAATMLLFEYEQVGDISFAPLMRQRLASLLGLRSSGWEEVQVVPTGMRELTDTLPLTGDMALLDWTAGDGMRLHLPEINVHDTTARQILTCTRLFNPIALGGVQVSFKQRPHDLRNFLRRVQRRQITKTRKYQGQYVATTSSMGAIGGEEESAWLQLPHDLTKIKEVHLSVLDKNDDDVVYDVWVNDVNLTATAGFPPVDAPGRVNLSGFVSKYNGVPVMKVQLKPSV